MPATNGQESLTGPPSDKQLIALHKFGCAIPRGLNRGDAHEWLTLLIGKKANGEEITDEDVAHLPAPSFRPASDAPAASFSYPAPAPAVSVAPAPTGEILPTPDSWVHYRTVLEESVMVGVVRRREIEYTVHPAPGETLDDTTVRIGRIAEARLDKGVADGRSAE